MTRMAAVILSTAMFSIVSVGHVRAQPSIAVCGVTYLEIAPTFEPSAVRLLRGHREAGRREPGNLRLEVLRQSGRPGHFVILESWRDQASFDQHRTNATTRAFLDALQPLQTSAADQRIFKDLAVGAAGRPTPASAILVVTHVDTIPNPQRDATALLARHAEESRQDAGNVAFDVFQQANRSNHFTIVEVWKDRNAIDRHAVAAHSKRYRDEIQSLLGSPMDERLFAVVR